MERGIETEIIVVVKRIYIQFTHIVLYVLVLARRDCSYLAQEMYIFEGFTEGEKMMILHRHSGIAIQT